MRLSLIIITLKIFLTVCSEGYMSVEDGNLSGNKENKVLSQDSMKNNKNNIDPIFVPDELTSEFEQLIVEPFNYDLGHEINRRGRTLYGGWYGYGGFRRRFCMLKVGGGNLYRMLDVDESKVQLVTSDHKISDSEIVDMDLKKNRFMSAQYCYKLESYVCCSPSYGLHGYHNYGYDY